MIHLHRWTALAVLLGAAHCANTQAKHFAYFHENVLGTSLELRISAADEAAAERAETVVLEEIERLNLVFSTYTAQSELSRLVAANAGESTPISAELASALEQCEHWQAASGGAFNPAAEELTRMWDVAAKRGAIPTAAVLTSAVNRASQTHWQLDASGERVTRKSDAAMSLNAIAKGIILDSAAAAAAANTGVDGVLVNIGGDIRIAGAFTAVVEVPRAMADTIGGPLAASLSLSSGAIATSGNSEREWKIAGQFYSHLIDPRNGQPVSHVASATVIADDSATADALATICCVLSPEESIGLIESITGAECFVQLATGDEAASSGWPTAQSPAKTAPQEESPDKKEPEKNVPKESGGSKCDMLVEFEIAKPGDSRRFRRPYVAVWIEDKDGFPVRTLSLFLMQNNPGPRWYRDLRRWYAGDQMRQLVDDTDVIKTMSKPTRNPGKYKVAWDGLDDHGEPLADGDYTLLIESAREHGTYQLMKHKFELSKSFETDLKANPEISAAHVRYKTE